MSQAGVKTPASQRKSTGQPAVYVTQGVAHVVGRAGLDGHLFDVWFDGAAGWKNDDVTALARANFPGMPAATYSPSVYEDSSGVGIVFRGVGGDLWVVNRSPSVAFPAGNAPTNLTLATFSQPAAGNPTSFVLNNEPHVVYRGINGLIYDIWRHGGTWGVQQVSAEKAAADPAATTNGTIGVVAVRAANGIIQAAQFDGTKWTSAPTIIASLSQSRVDSVGQGLGLLAQRSSSFPAPALPAIGSSSSRWENGIQFFNSNPAVDTFSEAGSDSQQAGENEGPLPSSSSTGNPFLLRLIETGGGGFSLDEVSDEGEINSLEALSAALDGLDSTSNVTFTDVNGVTTFNVQVSKSLAGQVDLDVANEVLGGLLKLNGTLEITGEVALNLTFGVDDTGFFIKPNTTTPEIVLSNLRITGDVSGVGQIGFLGVTVKDATLTLDPAVKINVKLRDPGTDAADGLIRLDELEGDIGTVATTTLQGNPTAPDVILTAKVAVAALADSNETLFDLGDAEIKLTWADVNAPEQMTFDVSAGPSEELLNFLQRSADGFLGGLSSAAGDFQQMAGVGLFAAKIPVVNKTLGEIMADVAHPLVVPTDAVSFVSSVFAVGPNQKFVVDVSGLDLTKKGVGVGDAVFYESGTGEVQGTIDAVDSAGFTVAFATGLNQDPNLTNPSFRIVGPGTIQSELTSFIDGLRHRLSIHGSTPTLQDMVEEVANLVGVNLDQLDVKVIGTGANRSVEFTIPFNPDPLQFTEHLDLGSSIEGLKLTAGGDVKFSVDPAFRLRVGIRLGGDVSVADRFYLAEDDTPEVTLGVSASLDNPNVTGTFGDFLQVKLQDAHRQSDRSGNGCEQRQPHHFDGAHVVQSFGYLRWRD